ncbi:MAG: OmpH family outer membrane protein [Bacteroidales bacterium]
MQDDNTRSNPEENTEDTEPRGNAEENTSPAEETLNEQEVPFSDQIGDANLQGLSQDLTAKPSRVPLLALIFSLIAIAGFLFLTLTRGNITTPDPSPRVISTINGDGSVSGTRIAFVRADSVQNNYLMTIHFLDSIEKRFRSMENDLMGRKKDYEKKIGNYYRDIQSGLLKESAALQIKERLEKEGDDIARLEESYTSRINDLQLKLNIIYFDSLWNFLDRHKAHFGVDMVVGYQQGLTNIFFADAEMDITEDVTALMNEEYIARYPNRKDLINKNK